MFYLHKILFKINNSPIQVKAGFAFLLCTVFQRAFSIITTPIFTRLLTPREYGEYSVFISWMGIISCFVVMSISSGIYTQAIIKFDEHRDQFSSSMQGLTLFLVLVWFLIYFCLREFWNHLFTLNTSQMTAMFVVMWTHAVFGFWSAEQRVEYKYKKLLFVTFFVSILQPILCVAFIYWFANKVTGLVWGIAISGLIAYIPLFIEQVKKGNLFLSGKFWLYSLQLAIPLIPHYLSVIALNSSDRIMIQNLTGSSVDAGIYNLAYTISMCGLLVNQAMLQTLNPWLYSKIKSQQFQDLKGIVYPVLICIACFNLIIILFTPEILMFFAPPSYYEAIWVMPPITMSVFFMFSYNLFSVFEFYYEKTHYVSIATVIGAALNILLNYIFIKQYGYFAAGYTTLFCYILFAAMHYSFMRRICKDKINSVKIYDEHVLIGISFVFVVLSFIIMNTFSNILIRYGIVLFVLAGLCIKHKQVIMFVKKLLNNKNISKRTAS